MDYAEVCQSTHSPRGPVRFLRRAPSHVAKVGEVNADPGRDVGALIIRVGYLVLLGVIGFRI